MNWNDAKFDDNMERSCSKGAARSGATTLITMTLSRMTVILVTLSIEV